MEIWLIYASLAAVFAALTTVLAKIGINNVNSHLATAIRTGVVVVFAWIMVIVTGSAGGIGYISDETWLFLVLSGLATGASWLCFFHALKLGEVSKVVPIDKSSTILTMILAFIILGEPVGLIMAIGMVLMAIGTWLMLELKKPSKQEAGRAGGWLVYALLAAVFASLVAIFGRIGVAEMDANLWTALRTMVVLPLAWLMVFKTGNQKTTKQIDGKSWTFLILSGVATGASWLFFYHALQNGPASHVVPIDKLSILLTMIFARLFLGERFSRQSLAGLTLLTIGTLMPVIF
ncbi:MAG: EamA family transporter [Defluviitaleaceae bacterium]|nr:EamA family transporter [Defluviitaleaceae bacterium]